jgi:hypothetical protein
MFHYSVDIRAKRLADQRQNDQKQGNLRNRVGIHGRLFYHPGQLGSNAGCSGRSELSCALMIAQQSISSTYWPRASRSAAAGRRS